MKEKYYFTRVPVTEFCDDYFYKLYPGKIISDKFLRQVIRPVLILGFALQAKI